MLGFTTFVRDIFCLAHAHRAAGKAGDGRAFERRVERHLAAVGVRSADIFSGVRSLGSQSLSGLRHQIDATGSIRDALVIGEWKAYRGSIPKNDLLRFKAATDDYWLRQYTFSTQPVMRVFGGTGGVSCAMRRYAAQWGICLITTEHWPTPLLASDSTGWPGAAPNYLERRYLGWLTRPIGSVYAPQPKGGWIIPRPLPDATIDHFLTLQDRWSAELWRRFDSRPGSFERWLEEMIPCGLAA